MADDLGSITDYFVFALFIISWVVFSFVRLRRHSPPARLSPKIWVALFAVVVGGLFYVNYSAEKPQERVLTLFEGIAPTYADELTRMGHGELDVKSAENDPRYHAMIAAEQRWLRLNPFISDIYTFRMKQDGTVYLMVDSATDYNRNGIIEPGREQRTAPGELYPQVSPFLRRAFAGEKNFMTTPITDRWGSWVSVHVPMYDKDGNVEAVLGVDYDATLWFNEYLVRRRIALALLALVLVILVTSSAGRAINRAQLLARGEAEGKLKDADARLRAMLDHLPFSLWLMGPTGTCVAHNSRAAETRSVRTGATLSEMNFSSSERSTLSKDVARTRAGEVIIRDLTREKGGVRKHYVQLMAPVPESSSGVGLVVVELDTTDRVEAENRRNMSERRLALHVEQTPLAYIEWDENLKIIRWNPAAEALFGFTVDEAIGKAVDVLIVPEAAYDEVRLVCRKLLTQKGGQRCTNDNVTKDGRTIVCEWHNTPLINEEGRVIAVASHAQNITDRVAMEGRLRQTQKLESMGALAGGVAHEFNNLLTPMLVQVGLVSAIYAQDDRLIGMLKPVEEAIMQAANLNQRILAVGRRTGELILPAKINPLIEGALDLLRQTLDRRIEIQLKLARNLPSVLVTKEAITQVVMNFTLNARDALLDKLASQPVADWTPQFSISSRLLEKLPADAPDKLRAAGRCVLLTFLDNGSGISEEVRHRIFEPFFTTKEPGKGTGLGLAVVWNVVDGLGGHIQLETFIGEGTEFRVYLPISANDHVPTLRGSGSKEISATPFSMPSLRILWVEDNQLVRETFAELLGSAGHLVDTAENGQKGLDLLLRSKARPYDLLLLDLNMPVLSGREVLLRIQGQGLVRAVIVVSGLADSIENADLLQIGADRVLRKPLGIKELLKTVSEVSIG